MSLYKRENSENYWCRFRVKGQHIRLSTGTANRDEAAEFEATARSKAWRQRALGERAPYAWKDAAKRWLAETTKRTKAKDAAIIAWFDQHLEGATVQGITREVIEELRALKSEESSPATADRHMALLRSILRKCVNDWQVLDAAPRVPMYRPPTAEPVWLTRQQFKALLKHLPPHLALAAEFAVYTGLRMRSMLGLTWDRVDLKARRAWVPRESMKAGATFGFPLSPESVAVLRRVQKLNADSRRKAMKSRERSGRDALPPDSGRVFQYECKPIDDCNTKAFQDAVKAAGVPAINWHGLRHTFASWAVQGGVTLHELMQLGDWRSYSMVLRYAHLAPDHLAEAARKVSTAPAKRRAQSKPRAPKAAAIEA